MISLSLLSPEIKLTRMMKMENVKVLGQYEAIKIGFEGKEGYLLISGNGDVRNNLQTDGENVNIFEPTADAQHSTLQNGYSENWDGFRKQSEYIQLLVQVQGTDHNVHKELDDAIAKIKELTYA